MKNELIKTCEPVPRIGVFYGPKISGRSSKGWIAVTKNYEKGFFNSKEEAEMALLEMMFA